MFSIVLVKHGNLVDINRAFYVLHRKNRLDYLIDRVSGPVELPVQTARTYPTQLLLCELPDGWALVRGNSCFDLAPIARALSGALATRALSVVHQPLHEESGCCLCEQGTELRRINRRHGRTAANGQVQSFEPGPEYEPGTPFGLEQLANFAQWSGAPIDLRDDIDQYTPGFHIHSA